MRVKRSGERVGKERAGRVQVDRGWGGKEGVDKESERISREKFFGGEKTEIYGWPWSAHQVKSFNE